MISKVKKEKITKKEKISENKLSEIEYNLQLKSLQENYGMTARIVIDFEIKHKLN